MSNEPLPTALDVRKAAVRETGANGVLKPADLPRFRAMLAGDGGQVDVALAFGRDEEERYLVRVTLAADVEVTCQRCLESMPLQLRSDNALAVVWNDQQAAALPRHLDPLIVEAQACNLHEVVEDELILAMPAFSYHDPSECGQNVEAFAEAAPDEEPPAHRPNPFNVLARLKAGEEQEP